jgi:hypothetical protein
MRTAIDGFEILRAIGHNSELFRSLRSEVDKFALALLKKHLKAKAMNIDAFHALQGAVSRDVLSLFLEELSEAELKSFTKKLDRHYPELASANASLFRKHLRALAVSEIEPSPKPVKAKKPAASKAGSVEKKAKPAKTSAPAQWPESMSAKPSRLRG